MGLRLTRETSGIPWPHRREAITDFIVYPIHAASAPRFGLILFFYAAISNNLIISCRLRRGFDRRSCRFWG